ncbi:MAG: CHAD domain-containing protein [Bacteroidota bacterium]|nr:CHAD domain-containing protein [Bacteroidota bacterium]
MTASKSIIEIYKEEQNSFLKHLRKAKDLEESQVHKLRVDIKNLRVLAALLKIIAPKKRFSPKPLLLLLSPVFKKAGKIRTATLNLKLIQHYKSPAMLTFKAHIKDQIKGAEVGLVKEIKSFKKKKLQALSKTHVSLFKKQKAEKINQKIKLLFEDELVKVKSHLLEMNNDENLHSIRKELKIIKNLASILKKIAPENPIPASIKKIESTYEKIGKWHDDTVLIEAIEKFVNSHNKIKPQLKTITALEKLKEKNHMDRLYITKKLRAGLL